MAATIDSVVQAGPRSWQVAWSSTLSDATFYLYLDGTLADVTQATSRVFYVGEGESLTLEVFDDSTTEPTAPGGGRVYLAWYAVADAERYVIEEYTGGAWVERATRLDTGEEYYRWRTRHLEDVTTHQFRVTALSEGDVSGTAANVSWFMVRVPDPPAVTYSYSETTHAVTVESA